MLQEWLRESTILRTMSVCVTSCMYACMHGCCTSEHVSVDWHGHHAIWHSDGEVFDQIWTIKGQSGTIQIWMDPYVYMYQSINQLVLSEEV